MYCSFFKEHELINRSATGYFRQKLPELSLITNYFETINSNNIITKYKEEKWHEAKYNTINPFKDCSLFELFEFDPSIETYTLKEQPFSPEDISTHSILYNKYHASQLLFWNNCPLKHRINIHNTQITSYNKFYNNIHIKISRYLNHQFMSIYSDIIEELIKNNYYKIMTPEQIKNEIKVRKHQYPNSNIYLFITRNMKEFFRVMDINFEDAKIFHHSPFLSAEKDLLDWGSAVVSSKQVKFNLNFDVMWNLLKVPRKYEIACAIFSRINYNIDKYIEEDKKISLTNTRFSNMLL